ncbi:RcnB family protein [Luteibacter sp. PPL201]|uniref:RcnB family protein n=1 Tax=Luteibacter sahnii TaxID=3021977 RepID=A0ABT6BFH2_9GAMM|nr:RcnB family protein [Luteibacter sp. PPL193]MDY1549185.1 RcnB family protein [Luteibacter sp. PPL193]
MNTLFRAALAALALSTATAAFAAPDHDRWHDRGPPGPPHHHDRGWHGHRPPPPPPRPHDGYGRYPHHVPPPYYGPRHHGYWERGHRYYGQRVVINDYGYYRLRPPPRGSYWVRDNSDFLLVAIATGVILDVASR